MSDEHRRRFLQTGLAAGGSFLASPLRAFGFDGAKPPPSRPVSNDIRIASKNARLSMQFHGTSKEECVVWQARFRKTLAELLGPHVPPKKWTAVEEKRIELDDHTRYELLLTGKRVSAVPVYLLIPRGASAKKPVPAVLCVHGHGAYGHHPVAGRSDLPGVAKAIKGANYDYGLQFVRRGYAVAAPCMVPFGRRVNRKRYGKTDPCATTFVRMQALGKLPIAENLRDLRWSLDLLQSRPEVRKDKLGCAGLSYGGRMTMLVSAMDDRIKAAAVSGALNLLQERIFGRYSCGSQIIPGLLKYGDYSEIGSLIASRHAVWEVGSKDGLVVPGWDKKFKDRLKRAYAALGVSGRLKFDHFEGGHRWNGKVAYPLFERVLKGRRES
ncbi:MAG: dienelactone hydrolase family protein [Planctomycetaceae bacterium]